MQKPYFSDDANPSDEICSDISQVVNKGEIVREGCACERNGEVSLPQVLHLISGEVTTGKVANGSGWLTKALKDEKDDDKLLDSLFLRMLSRLPQDAERAKVKELRKDARSQLGMLEQKQREAARLLGQLSAAAGESLEDLKRSADSMLADARATATSVVDRFRRALER